MCFVLKWQLTILHTYYLLSRIQCVSTSEPNNTNINFSLTPLVWGYKFRGVTPEIFLLSFLVFTTKRFCLLYFFGCFFSTVVFCLFWGLGAETAFRAVTDRCTSLPRFVWVFFEVSFWGLFLEFSHWSVARQ